VLPASDVRDLLRVALGEFENANSTVATSARRALRIAAHRHDYGNQLWLQWELTDITVTHKGLDPSAAQIIARLNAVLGVTDGKVEHEKAWRKYERTRAYLLDGKQMIHGAALGQVERNLATARAAYDGTVVPANLTPIDTFFVAKKAETTKANLLVTFGHLEQVVERVKTAVYAFLVATEAELDEGQKDSPLFVRAQEYINAALAKYAPDGLEKFLAAQDRVYSGEPEDLAHALTSCRRMIKSVADALYPATGIKIVGRDGVERSMSDDAYRNRLLQYVHEQVGKHMQGPVLQATIDSLGSRLKSLESLASKGVHDRVSAAEAETCIVWTYLLVADILRIADGSSALLVSETQPPA